jgi:hypothetical protein
MEQGCLIPQRASRSHNLGYRYCQFLNRVQYSKYNQASPVFRSQIAIFRLIILSTDIENGLWTIEPGVISQTHKDEIRY